MTVTGTEVKYTHAMTLTSMAALMKGELVLGFITLATEGALEGPVRGVSGSPVLVEM